MRSLLMLNPLHLLRLTGAAAWFPQAFAPRGAGED
jgi:hypothetical protein